MLSVMLSKYLVILIIFPILFVHCVQWHYHNNAQLEEFLQNFTNTTKGPLRTKLFSIGASRKGNKLWVAELTATKEGKIGVPNIKLVGTVHGNEPVGREILLHFMEYLTKNYKKDPTITWLLDNTRIHFLPNFNPDGFALSNENMCTGEHVRNNGLSGKDLNRNFPDYYHKNRIPVEPETVAMKNWLKDVPFVLSAALHGGALVVNYPFDTVKELTSYSQNPPSLTPDNDVFVYLANVYAQNHLTMHQGDTCEASKFKGGVTNGASWYTIIGGMQDYNYAFHGCMELTLEISCCKYPPAKDLPRYWEENKMALVKYCMEALRGVTGQIVDGETSTPVAHASLRISGRNMTFRSSKSGEFWRILLPGNYKLEISATGYYDKVVPFVVENFEKLPLPTFLNISLINSSMTTTTEQITTETTFTLAETTSDGVSHGNLSVNVLTEDNPTPASLRTSLSGGSALINKQKHIVMSIFTVIFFML